jgi:hypothetical protein
MFFKHQSFLCDPYLDLAVEVDEISYLVMLTDIL